MRIIGNKKKSKKLNKKDKKQTMNRKHHKTINTVILVSNLMENQLPARKHKV